MLYIAHPLVKVMSSVLLVMYNTILLYFVTYDLPRPINIVLITNVIRRKIIKLEIKCETESTVGEATKVNPTEPVFNHGYKTWRAKHTTIACPLVYVHISFDTYSLPKIRGGTPSLAALSKAYHRRPHSKYMYREER